MSDDEIKADFSSTMEWVIEGLQSETLGALVGAPPEMTTADAIFQWMSDIEYLRFENCLKQAAEQGHGLLVKVFEFETKYYLDPTTPPNHARCIPIGKP